MANHYGTPGAQAGSQIEPDVEEAIHRLGQTELSPLEEAMFQSWSNANDVVDAGGPHNGLDFRGIYKDSGGKMFPPGLLKQHADKQEAIQTMMKAHAAHAAADPMAALRAKISGSMGAPGEAMGSMGEPGGITGGLASGAMAGVQGGEYTGGMAGGLGTSAGGMMSIPPNDQAAPGQYKPMSGAGGGIASGGYSL